MNDRYEKIINVNYHGEESPAQMSNRERAAQFMPFAALSGYDDAVRETARLTDSVAEPGEYEVERINSALRKISSSIEGVRVRVTYFIRDAKKEGGAYYVKEDVAVGVDEYKRALKFQSSDPIDLDIIMDIEELDL